MSTNQEIIILVGYPGSGKTTFTEEHYNDNYIIIHGDDYKSNLKKMLKASIPYIKEGKSIVFDATNGTKKKRSEYINFAKEHNIPIKCVHISTSFEESLIRNKQRKNIVPNIVYYIYKKNFQEPLIEENFTEVIII
jgi:bifunctional polynucleotide phosphatase/kinase